MNTRLAALSIAEIRAWYRSPVRRRWPRAYLTSEYGSKRGELRSARARLARTLQRIFYWPCNQKLRADVMDRSCLSTASAYSAAAFRNQAVGIDFLCRRDRCLGSHGRNACLFRAWL